MTLAKVRRVGRTVYNSVKDGLHTVDAIIHKAAMVYTLTHPLIRQAYDTRPMDENLLAGYTQYQQARQLGAKIHAIVK